MEPLNFDLWLVIKINIERIIQDKGRERGSSVSTFWQVFCTKIEEERGKERVRERERVGPSFQQFFFFLVSNKFLQFSMGSFRFQQLTVIIAITIGTPHAT